MASWKCRRRALTLLALLAMFGNRSASAEFLTPDVFVSIDDDRPVNGIGDAFSEIPGMLRRLDYVETRAIAEFQLGELRVGDLASARLFLELTVNNSGGNQIRGYDVFLYKGNGQADLFDYFQVAVLVDHISFEVPQAPDTFDPIPFELDILDAAQTFLSSQDDAIGIRLRPIGANHYPTILTKIQLSVIPVPEPSGVILMSLGLGLGLGRLWRGHQRL